MDPDVRAELERLRDTTGAPISWLLRDAATRYVQERVCSQKQGDDK
jgi:hypothetical protein